MSLVTIQLIILIILAFGGGGFYGGAPIVGRASGSAGCCWSS